MKQILLSSALAIVALAVLIVTNVSAKTVTTPGAAPGATTTPTTNEPTVVTSDRLQTDYASNIGTFDGNVVAVDPRMTLRADKMIVFFNGTNSVVNGVTNTERSVTRIIAIGGVIINQEKKKATSDRADYSAAEDKIILTEHPKVEGPDGSVTGKKITIWHRENRMDVEADAATTNRTQMIIYPDEQRKQNNETK